MHNKKNTFHWRSYISFALAITFLMISISGIILYIAPPGRIARWISWIMLGMSRAQWESQHTLFSCLFIILAVVHLFFMNWQLFFSYLGKKIGNGKSYSKEVITASATIFIIFVITLFEVTPAVNVMNLGGLFSDSWAKKISQPPVPHTEEMTLNDIAASLIDTTSEILIEKIRSEGYEVTDGNQTLNDIADRNGVSPSTVFDAISPGFTLFRLKVD
ncbi:MAG: DUF4405 domain-containing protein [Bacteroidales bacterium]|nr:DUF4405 domain-containing protein [Bacteroidales bacterium]